MRLTQIDESNLADHARLTAEDLCYYIYEYTSGQNYAFSATNGRINNLKKKPTSSAAELRYKARAIRLCADDMRTVLNSDWLDRATIVPVPSSKAADHPDHDDRMEQVARLIRPNLDVRALVRQDGSTVAAHEAGPGERATVEDLLQRYVVDESLTQPALTQIGIFDDVLTAGTHFRAMQTVLSARFPNAGIVGLFIARRVFQNPFADLEF